LARRKEPFRSDVVTIGAMPAADTTLKDELVQLIRRTSTTLPPDVEAALRAARDGEPEGSLARRTLSLMLENAEEARRFDSPICHDVGTLHFDVEHGPDMPAREVESAVLAAVREARRLACLRPEGDDPLPRATVSAESATAPDIRLRKRTRPGLRVRLVMDGQGAQNVGAAYALPDAALGAGCDLDGVRRCVVDALRRSQGFCCAPGTIGVGVAGDHPSALVVARDQLLRKLDDTNPDPALAALEAELVPALDGLGIGPMGFGGRTTVLGVKIGAPAAIPSGASVAIAFMCWAYRRGELVVPGARRAARSRG
jgi:fumarate hydratase class I